MSCALASVRGSVCRCDPRNCMTCKSTEPQPDEFVKRNAWRLRVVLNRARKDTRAADGRR